MTVFADHPHADPGDGRSECEWCGKWVWLVVHSCKGVPVTEPAIARYEADPEAWIAARLASLTVTAAPVSGVAARAKGAGDE